MRKFIEIKGQRFGKWLVIEPIRKKGTKILWLCKCDCGNEGKLRGHLLVSGKTKSCGCAANEVGWETRRQRYGLPAVKPRTIKKKKEYGVSRYPEFKIWVSMRLRCSNPNITKYSDYGGRGIRVCERWQNSFLAFITDVGRRPSTDYSLDRIDVNGDYEPGNVRWATWSEQCRNKRVTNPNGVPGVYWDKTKNNYRVYISLNKKNIYVGRFKDKSEAIKARQDAEIKYWSDNPPI